MTPGQEREAFLEDVKRIARGQRPLNPDMLPENREEETQPGEDRNG